MPRPKSPDGLQINVPSFLSRLRPTRGEDLVQGQATGQDGGAVRHISVVERWRGDGNNNQGGFREKRESYQDVLYISRPAKWKQMITFGISLDSWAKFFLTVSMFISGFALTYGAGQLILRRRDGVAAMTTGNLRNTLAVMHTTWGVFSFVVSLIGFIILWGRLRKSTTAVQIYTLVIGFLVMIYLMAAILWFYFAANTKPSARKNCLKQAQRLEKQEKFTENVKTFYDACYMAANVSYNLSSQIIWGLINVAQTYFGIIFVLWGRDYARRLNLEEASKGMKGLVLLNGDLEDSEWRGSIKDISAINSPADFDTPYTVVAEPTPVMVPIKPAMARIVTVKGVDIDVPAMPPLPPSMVFINERPASAKSSC